MNEFLTDWNAIFMKKISKLHYSAILSSSNWRSLVALGWSYIGIKDFIMYGTCSRKKRTNLLQRQTIQRLTKFLILYAFFKILLRTRFPWKMLPFTDNFIFQLSTSNMTALSNPFMSGWYRQFYMRTTQWHFKGTFKSLNVLV